MLGGVLSGHRGEKLNSAASSSLGVVFSIRGRTFSLREWAVNELLFSRLFRLQQIHHPHPEPRAATDTLSPANQRTRQRKSTSAYQGRAVLDV